MKKCTVCSSEHQRKADTCSVSCAAKIGNKGKSIKAAFKNWAILIERHGGMVEFPRAAPSSCSEVFKVKCGKHGYIDTTITRMLSWKNSCSKCGENKSPVIGDKKQCNVCKELKHIKDFRVIKKKNRNGNGYIKYRCIECDNIKDKEFRQTNSGKQVNKRANKKYRAKKFEKGELVYKSSIRCVVCPVCSKLHIEKGLKDINRYCSDQCKTTGRKGWTKQLKNSACCRCGKQHIAKSKNTMCDECRNRYEKAVLKAYKIKRKLKIEAVTIHPVIDKKVFDRDKWRCKICKTKVQKNDLYASNAAEVDHIVPLSKGGVHSYSNVQTLCRSCNNKKSNVYNGQLVLSI